MFFDYDPAREPADRRVPRRALHVPQRAAGEALRHRRRDRARVPPRRSHDHRTRRRAEPGQRARRVELSDADVGRDSRQVHPAEHPRHAAAAAAAGRAAARRAGRRAPPRRCASRWRCIAPNAICASCHSRMDPLGFALENYDAIGKWRTMDGGLPGGFERRPAGRQEVLDARPRCARSSAAASDEFSRTLTEKLLIYALGRGLERYDRPTVRDITTRLGRLRLRLPDAGARGRRQPAVPVAARRGGANSRGDEIAPAWSPRRLDASRRVGYTWKFRRSSSSLRAEVAELADAQASGACGRKVVEVQILSSAPLLNTYK